MKPSEHIRRIADDYHQLATRLFSRVADSDLARLDRERAHVLEEQLPMVRRFENDADALLIVARTVLKTHDEYMKSRRRRGPAASWVDDLRKAVERVGGWSE